MRTGPGDGPRRGESPAGLRYGAAVRSCSAPSPARPGTLLAAVARRRAARRPRVRSRRRVLEAYHPGASSACDLTGRPGSCCMRRGLASRSSSMNYGHGGGGTSLSCGQRPRRRRVRWPKLRSGLGRARVSAAAALRARRGPARPNRRRGDGAHVAPWRIPATKGQPSDHHVEEAIFDFERGLRRGGSGGDEQHSRGGHRARPGGSPVRPPPSRSRPCSRSGGGMPSTKHYSSSLPSRGPTGPGRPRRPCGQPRQRQSSQPNTVAHPTRDDERGGLRLNCLRRATRRSRRSRSRQPRVAGPPNRGTMRAKWETGSLISK